MRFFILSLLRKQEPRKPLKERIPTCAGMTSRSGNTTKKTVVSETSTGIVIKENTEKTKDSI